MLVDIFHISLFACVGIHQGHERLSDESGGRQDIFMCLVALLCEQFLPICNGGAKMTGISQTQYKSLVFLELHH